MGTRSLSCWLVVVMSICPGLQAAQSVGREFQSGERVVAARAAVLKVGQEVRGDVPAGTELQVRSVKGEWVAVALLRETGEVRGWIHRRDLAEPAEYARRVAAGETLDAYPRSMQLANFKAHPQQSANTCSAAAARDLLHHVTGNAPWEMLLFMEIVGEDHKGLSHLEDRLRQLGIDNPMALSSFGGTPVGLKAVIGKRLRNGLRCDFKEISEFEDRLLVIVRSINNGWPVIAPVVSSSLQHWITITGYDRDSRQFSTSSFGTLSFDDFNTLNSWTTTPGGLLGRAFQLANEEHMGRRVLVYVTKEEPAAKGGAGGPESAQGPADSAGLPRR